MKNATFITLSIVTAITVSAAIAVTSGRNSNQEVPGAGQKAFPGLINVVNDVRSISIETINNKMIIVQYPDHWGEKQKGGYSVRAGAVRKLLIEMSGLDQTDPKTQLKKNYSRLELRDISEEGARSKKVTLKDKNGKVLAAVLIGMPMRNLEGKAGVYFRKVGIDQSWMSKSIITVGLKPADWLETPIIDIKPKRIQKITVRHPDGEVLTIAKTTTSDKHYTIENFPSKATLKSAFVVDPLASSLDNLKLDDVMKASNITMSKDFTVNVNITTFDGLNIALQVLELSGKYWITVAASAKEGTKQMKEANKINARTDSWAYKIAGFKATGLKNRLSDLIIAED